MAEKKAQEEKKSVASKVTKKTVAKKAEPKVVQKNQPKVIKTQPTGKKIEPHFPAKELAEKQGIESFEFFVIKRSANIKDDTVLTAAEMQELYKKIIKG
jgi:hypothetical protein